MSFRELVLQYKHIEGSTATASTTTAVAAPASPSKRRKKQSQSYAPPALYAHLPTPDLDALAPDLICLFIGLNPGIATAKAQHAWASPTNSFWRMMYESGCVERRLTCLDDKSLPMAPHYLGITNLVARPTRSQSELSFQEMVAAVEEVVAKVRKWKPRALAVVGKGIWEAIFAYEHGGRKMSKADGFEFGWQKEQWQDTRAFVMPSTSGKVAAYSPAFKKGMWCILGEYVAQARKDRFEGKVI